MACRGNYWQLYGQPVGFEQMSRIPCRVIWLIYNCHHFQSPSPAWLCHHRTWLQSNSVLLRRKSIGSRLCWRRAQLIFMSCAGIMVAGLGGEHELGGVLFTEHDLWGQHMRQNTHALAQLNIVENLGHVGHQLIYSKSQFTEPCVRLRIPALDVHPSLVQSQ